MRTLLILLLIASPAFAQDAEDQGPSIPPELADLADEYAQERANRARADERARFRKKKQQWIDGLENVADLLERADERADAIGDALENAGRTDPEIGQIQTEMRARIGRAEKWVGQLADIEQLPENVGEAFANIAAGKLGLKIDFGAKDRRPPPVDAELLPPYSSGSNNGWVTDALNSDEAKGAGGSALLLMILYYLKRQRENDKEDGDKRNDRVTESAAERAFERWQKKQAASGGSGGDTRS